MKSIKLDGHTFSLSRMSKHSVRLVIADPNVNAAYYAEQIQIQKIKGLDNVISSNEEMLIISKKPVKVLKKIVNLEWKKPNVKNWKIPVCFDGLADWKEVETLTGIEKGKYLELLLKQPLTVAMLGFIPGFVYIDGLAKEMQLARKKSPVRNLIPNVLAIGGPYVGIYSLPSPSGWQILGRIPISILNLKEMKPIDFSINDGIELEEINEQQFDRLFKVNYSLKEYNE